MRLVNETDTYTKTTQMKREDLLARQTAFLASVRAVQGISDEINTDKPPTSYKDAMSRPDAQEWAEVHQKEYKGFMDRNASQWFRFLKAQTHLVPLLGVTVRSTTVYSSKD
jgi:hypothetical protein